MKKTLLENIAAQVQNLGGAQENRRVLAQAIFPDRRQYVPIVIDEEADNQLNNRPRYHIDEWNKAVQDGYLIFKSEDKSNGMRVYVLTAKPLS